MAYMPYNGDGGVIMGKVYCLYRVSDRGQVEKNDIPMQKIACRTFAQCHGWEITKEFTEKGVSGYKLHMDDRDAIMEIKNDAILGKFNILLVFMFDRIGRRDDETPFVVEWLVKHEISVWSVCEGEQRFDHHVDKLTNYIRYWQAAGESERISERTRTRIRQLTSEGYFTGGVCPFGYQLVRQGRENKKKQPLYDLVVHPQEAKVVAFIFAKAGQEGYGVYRLAKLLNEKGYYPKSGQPWVPVSLYHLLRNPLYIGMLHKGDVISYQENLQIISKELFDETQKLHRAKSAINDIAENASCMQGALLSGFLYCETCGSRMASNHINRSYRRKDGTVRTWRTQRYYCPRKENEESKTCTGQHIYVAKKVECIFMEQLTTLLSDLEKYSAEELSERKHEKLRCDVEARLHTAKQGLQKVESEIETLQVEMLSCLKGQSAFTAEQISSLLTRLEDFKADLEEQIQAISAEQANLNQTLCELKIRIRRYQSLWAEYTDATLERKKIVLLQFIENIKISGGYQLKISINSQFDSLIYKV